MLPDQLEQQLQAWGTATLNRFSAQRWERSDHMLAKQRQFGVKSKSDDRQPVGRYGGDRRRHLAQNASTEKLKLHIVPMWAVDPVRSANDAGPPRDIPEAVVDMGIPEDLLWLDRAISRLYRVNLMRALCVREEYCTTGTKREKAARVAAAYGGAMSERQYRHQLQLAKEGFRMSIAA